MEQNLQSVTWLNCFIVFPISLKTDRYKKFVIIFIKLFLRLTSLDISNSSEMNHVWFSALYFAYYKTLTYKVLHLLKRDLGVQRDKICMMAPRVLLLVKGEIKIYLLKLYKTSRVGRVKGCVLSPLRR